MTVSWEHGTYSNLSENLSALRGAEGTGDKPGEPGHNRGDDSSIIWCAEKWGYQSLTGFRDKRKLINSILSEHNNHTIKLDQNGSNDNLCPWVSSRSDYYKFVNENDSHSIKRLFEREKLIKKFIIDKITQNYINKIIDKKDKSIDSPGFKEYIDEKRTEYKSELHHKDLKTLKIMSDFKLEDLNTNKENEDYEIIDEVPLDLEYELC